MFRTSPKHRKLELLLQNDIPTQSEVRTYLGASLAQVLFDYSHRETRKLLGIIPPLKGPQKELWISSSDRLIGKVSLTPPLTDTCIKACTHQGILALGQVALDKHQAYIEEKMTKHFKEELVETRRLFEAEKRRSIELTQQDLRLQHENYIGTLQSEFERKLEAALANVTENCNKTMQKAVVRQRMEVTQEMLKKMRDEISYVIGSLYDDFQQAQCAQRERMIADFNEIIRRERIKMNVEMKEFERQKAEALRVQRHELEIQNTVDVTNILCLERMRSSSEKHSIHKCFEKQIQALQDLLAEANETVNLVKEEIKDKIEDERAWKNKFRKVIREFQKFINFAFKAVPGQAEFLISLESLFIIELDEEIRKWQERHRRVKDELFKPKVSHQFEVVEILDKYGHKWIPMKLIPDSPQLYCTEEQLMTPIVKSELNFCLCDDYANVASATSIEALRTYQSHPSCYFENVLYVRSDHREDVEIEKKTMAELAEDARFIMRLKKSKSCNLQLLRDIRDEVPSPSIESCTSKYEKTDENKLSTVQSVQSLVCKEELRVEKNSEIQVTACKSQIQQLIQAIQCIDKQDELRRNSITETSNENNTTIRSIMAHLRMVKNIMTDDNCDGKTFQIIGEDGVEHLQTPRQFTCARMYSLMRIFQLHPSLQRMLIPKSGKALY